MMGIAWKQCAQLLPGNALHIGILMLPTLLLAGLSGIDWITGCFAMFIASAAIMESVLVRQSREFLTPAVHDRTAMRVAALVGIILLAIFWSAQVERAFRLQSFLMIQSIGGLCLTIGIYLRIAAIHALGDHFISDIRVDHILVHTGIYAWLRHPSEAGMLLIAVGGPLLLGAPISATAAAIILTPISMWRMHRENIALSA